MPNKLADGKKRYSLSLTKATMDRLHEQFLTLGEKHPRRVSAVITLMVDHYLGQVAQTVMPLVMEKAKEGKPLSELEFAEILIKAMRAEANI